MAEGGSRGAQGSRRPRQQARRWYRVEFSLTEEEFAALEEAAGRAGLARGAYAAEAALLAARGSATAPDAAVPGGAGRADPRRRAGAQDRRPAEPGGREAERDRAASRRAGPVRAGVPAPRGAPGRRRGAAARRRSGDDPAPSGRAPAVRPRRTARPPVRGPGRGPPDRDPRPARTADRTSGPAVRAAPVRRTGRTRPVPDRRSRPVIGKITAPRGKRVEPLIYYLYGPGRHEEHTDPHIVAGWRHPAELEPPLRADGTRDFRRLFGLLNQPHAAMGKLRGPTGRCGTARCAPPPRDKTLSDDEWAQIAGDVMNRTGLSPYGEEDDGVRWIAVRHGDDHIHIVAMLARQDGRRRRLEQRAVPGPGRVPGRRGTLRAGSTAPGGPHRRPAPVARRDREGRPPRPGRGPPGHAAPPGHHRRRRRGQRRRVLRPPGGGRGPGPASGSAPRTPARSPGTRSRCPATPARTAGRCGSAAASSPPT